MKISLVKPGVLERDAAGRIHYASSSVTLIISDKMIVVDTGSHDSRDVILSNLNQLGISRDDVEVVVNTHLHEDHTGNNDIFSNADVFAYHSGLREGYTLAKDVIVIETPGHTLDSISILCIREKPLVIAGDALPTVNNYIKGLPPRIHRDRDLALKSMRKISRLAKIVVPGHGVPFSIPDGIEARIL